MLRLQQSSKVVKLAVVKASKVQLSPMPLCQLVVKASNARRKKLVTRSKAVARELVCSACSRVVK